jgi:transcriptional regulator with XRE-family HTH domain
VKLRALREYNSLSTRELAELAGVHRHTIIRLENDQTGAHPRTVRRLAEALGVHPSELTGK